MSKAFKCDRCKTYVDQDPHDVDPCETNRGATVWANDKDGLLADLCPSCAALLAEWWDKK